MKTRRERTVRDVLLKCNLGDMLTNGNLRWEVTDLDCDGCVVARPLDDDSFELWSRGVESIAVIPGLRLIL